MAHVNRPSKEAIGKIAERQPELLNVLVAYFVMEWREVRLSTTPHGVDQVGVAAVVPNYVRWWGIDRCVHYLCAAPQKRRPRGPGILTGWLMMTAYDEDRSILDADD